MQTMDAHLAQLVRMGRITRKLAEQRASVPRSSSGCSGQRRHPGRPPAAAADGANGAEDEHLRIQGGRRRRDPLARRGRRRVQGPGHRAAARPRPDRPRRLGEERAFKLEQVFDRFRAIKARDMAIFSRQFATLIDSGMPMLRSLHTLEDQTEDERLRDAITGIRQDVEAGSSLADAMERRPRSSTRSSARWCARARLGSPRRGARSGRLPAGEAGCASASDPLGDDVPGLRLRPRRSSSCWSSSPSSSRSSPGSSRRSPRTARASPRSCRS